MQKQKLNLGPKILYFGVLGRIFEKLLLYLKQVPSIWSDFKILCRSKMPNFFSFSILVFFFLPRTFTIRRRAGEGGSYLFESSLPLPPASQTNVESNRQTLVSERKSLTTKQVVMPTFETKNNLFEYFWGWILRNYFHICHQRPAIYLIATFCEKTNTLKFWTKNTLFRC